MRQIQKYTWLINTLHNSKGLSFEEISDYWAKNTMLSDGNSLSRATFNRWRDCIEAIFHIRISCKRKSGNRYYIDNPEALEGDEVRRYILDSIAMGNLIYENLSLTDRIIIDKRPSGYTYFSPMLAAMKENRMVTMTYQSYEDSYPRTFRFEPYCVKLFENRWYALGRDLQSNRLLCYGLDRILNMVLEDVHFRVPDSFSADKFYQHLYGIVSTLTHKPQSIIIRAYKKHAKYLESLPLHHSQTKVSETNEYADFELFLVPEYDFIMRLLHDGALVEVLKPMSLRKAMKGWISDMYDLYEDTEN